jgi:hypothetical protein
MMSFRTSSLATPIGLLWLVLVTQTVGCADEKNPVLPPSTGGPGVTGGSSSSSKSDAATAASEAGQASEDVLASSDEVNGALLGPPCNLLEQDCIDGRNGCYPVGGAGVCLRAGIRTELMTCLVDTDCDRGLVCVPLSGLGSQGLCEPLCELKSGAARACPTQICAQRDGYPEGIGACTSS